MFRKFLFVCMVLALAAFAVPALAGITNTAHQLTRTGLTGGSCAVCHLPHGAVQGARLWVEMPSGTIPGAAGSVGQLCGYCHFLNQSGGSGPNWDQDAPSPTRVYGAASHGRNMGIDHVPGLPRSYNAIPYASNGFPYISGVSDQIFECTSCHDVHNDGVADNPNGHRPFLRADINVLCTGCHDNRMYINTTPKNDLAGTGGNWGLANVGISNPGSHPVGNDITGNVSGGNSPITIIHTMRVPYNNAQNQWAIGGHLSNGAANGGVTCVTCHAVHGVRGDSHFAASLVAPADSHVPFVNFLALQQNAYQPDADGRDVANGGRPASAADPNNRLCEGCHQGFLLDTGYAPGTVTSTYNPNPGGTAYSHPVDQMNAMYYTWVTAFPAQWPIGYWTNKSTPNVICESCHVAHPAANIDTVLLPGTVRGDLAGVTESDYILRGTWIDVCQKCHTGSIVRHHPVNVAYNKANVTYLNVGAGTAGTLNCGTCHSGAGAHNWQDSRNGVGINPAWKPLNNGRAALPVNDRYDTRMSKTCMDCHYGLRNSWVPTDGGALNTNYSGGTNENSLTYGNLGRGTHALGVLGQNGAVGIRMSKGSKALYWGSLYPKLTDPEAQTWNAAYFGGQGGWSRFGGTATVGQTVLVCESCHELQPSKNAITHLLLGVYTEQLTANLSTRSRFCEACHVPVGTHQTWGEIVKTGGNHTLLTSVTAARPWMGTPDTAEASNVILDQTANIISCDSCHQVHQANTGSRTFIVDVSSARYGTGGATFSGTRVASFGSYSTPYPGGIAYFPSIWTGKGPAYTAFCQQCHPY